ncbi:hypothetical protein R6258_01565 [Halomonas sp. HP20-15]|uniref:hypothetical protein n=1 Tax=Halomonas sp. HP20-15 TaxID=3085901 RepID=UPI00298204A0|nr:hypothetical protein [Halomonas sp. HP20-15]MDW5375596.1 hypothetical protein [Halomonas sp. HP20-15]
MTTRVMTAERVSILCGILIAMVATLLRYVANGVAQDRMILLCIAAVVVSAVAVASWRLLDEGARQRFPALMGRMIAAMASSLLVIAVWQGIRDGMVNIDGLAVLSHGTALGLLIHALASGWRRKRA